MLHMLQDFKIVDQFKNTLTIQHKYTKTLQTLHIITPSAKLLQCTKDSIPIVQKTDAYIILPHYPHNLKKIINKRKLSMRCLKTILYQMLKYSNINYTSQNIFIHDGFVKINMYLDPDIDMESCTSIIKGNIGALALEMNMFGRRRKEKIKILDSLSMGKVAEVDEIGKFAYYALCANWDEYVRKEYDGFFDGIDNKIPMQEILSDVVDINNKQCNSVGEVGSNSCKCNNGCLKHKIQKNTEQVDNVKNDQVKQDLNANKTTIINDSNLLNNKISNKNKEIESMVEENKINIVGESVMQEIASDSNTTIELSVTENLTSVNNIESQTNTSPLSAKNKRVFKVMEYEEITTNGEKGKTEYATVKPNISFYSVAQEPVETKDLESISTPISDVNTTEASNMLESMKITGHVDSMTNKDQIKKETPKNTKTLDNDLVAKHISLLNNIEIKSEEVEYKKGRFTVQENRAIIRYHTPSEYKKMETIITLQKKLIDYYKEGDLTKNRNQIKNIENTISELSGENGKEITGRGSTY